MPFIFHTEAFRPMFSNPFGINNLVLSIKNIGGITLKIFPLMISLLKAGIFLIKEIYSSLNEN